MKNKLQNSSAPQNKKAKKAKIAKQDENEIKTTASNKTEIKKTTPTNEKQQIVDNDDDSNDSGSSENSEGESESEDVSDSGSDSESESNDAEDQGDAQNGALDQVTTSNSVPQYKFVNKNVSKLANLAPTAPVLPKSASEKESAQRLIVILEAAPLETYKIGKHKDANYQLLNCDDHQNILKKLGLDLSHSRPDITHQCLLSLLDSPLNKAGKLQVYIKTTKNVLIEINPQVRIPRTFKRFSGLMVQLLHKLSIRSVNGTEKLMKVIKNPITDHLPINSRKICFSYDSPTVHLQTWVRKNLPTNMSLVVAIGAMAHGKDNFADAYVDEKIGISEYPLSASVACSKLCCAFEDIWGIL
ncbi:Ribosomal RNA small subunit methyltransferase mra1 [Smittium culicis]|uniref:Ribosomal RNA small subunit methyltransferase mra1 n=1 Tax=Smittium culicis TaxID=133412 RepID=A0A1R1YSV1_9FUNG|nr:Ribosomal RNA small subunit methyltransferase mra1 [Smittium culicis]